MISTRGRYALRVLMDLAEHKDCGLIPLKEITLRQGISQKYLEGIMTSLSKAGLVEGASGRGGGYKLSKAPEEYSIGEILDITESSMAPVSCLEKGASRCAEAGSCKTFPMWSKLNSMVNEYLSGVSLKDLMEEEGDLKSCGRC